MEDLYKKILEKPEAYRRRLVFVITGVIGVIIFSVWLSITYSSMQEMINPPEEKEGENSVPQKSGAPSLEDKLSGENTPNSYSDSLGEGNYSK